MKFGESEFGEVKLREHAEKIVLQSVKCWNSLAQVIGIEPMTPDASLRRYFRVRLSNPDCSIVAMVFDSVSSPEAGGRSIQSDRSYVELTRFLQSHGIAVPELLYDNQKEALLLIEDLGDRLLADLLLGEKQADSASLRDYDVEKMYRMAIDQIERLQTIKPLQGFFPFERSFTQELYQREMSEYADYVLHPIEASREIATLVDRNFSLLADKLSCLPQVLVHRDFHSWNLMVDHAEC